MIWVYLYMLIGGIYVMIVIIPWITEHSATSDAKPWMYGLAGCIFIFIWPIDIAWRAYVYLTGGEDSDSSNE